MISRASHSNRYGLDHGQRAGLCAELTKQLHDARAEHAALLPRL